jgi:hypothetical protein
MVAFKHSYAGLYYSYADLLAARQKIVSIDRHMIGIRAMTALIQRM